ncbi:SDR family oxidoreductase [Streptomyces sp. NPDC000658]|uniref:SDR family oxidoreductase n=1 Tax=Streptomyces sp. NPDC000658 TaxID=3154266 RepID=UPI0033327F1D
MFAADTVGSSIASEGPFTAYAGYFPVAHTVSKWALRGVPKIAATELGAGGVRVCPVHPGCIETVMTVAVTPAFRGTTIRATFLGHSGTVDDVAPTRRLPPSPTRPPPSRERRLPSTGASTCIAASRPRGSRCGPTG